jgi:hypothetical protein
MDRLELEHFVRQMYNYIWNFDTQKPCRKQPYKNNSGGETLKGELVKFDPAEDYAVVLTGADDHECIGVWAESGIEDGEIALVITGGSALVMLENLTLSAPGNIILTSATGGRADMTLAVPPLGGVAQLDAHMQELGHCCETQAPGTDVLAEGTLHFN